MSHRHHRSTRRKVLSYVLLVAFALVFLAPFLLQLANSLKTDGNATANELSLVPHPVSLAGWQQVLGIGSAAGVADFPRWLMNSLVVSLLITVGRVFLDSLAGYALARLHFRGRRLVFGLVVATLMVPSVTLLIPQFLIIKQLGIFNSYPGMILPMLIDATGIYLMRQFFLQVPVALEEAARIDGAGTFTTYWRVVLPMVRPGLITLTILSFQAAWNQYAFFLVATVSPQYFTLTTGLANIVDGGLSAGNQFPLKLAAAMLTTVPVAVLFFVFQRYLRASRFDAAVKG
ncbi:MAG: carbohydrate ABC transporter permease [Actinomycetota bacterium]|nr:carbohydrate ABC transporter permease [Actinomycetota bacterium]